VLEKEIETEKLALSTLSKILSEKDKKQIVVEAEFLKKSQEKIQDLSVLPTLTLSDIPRAIEFTHIEKRVLSNVKTHWIEQPTNGISHIRIKANLKNLPLHL
jgi:presequence protease